MIHPPTVRKSGMRRRCGAPAMSARMQTMIIYTASNSAAYARTRRARTQVGTALEVILLLISGLGIQFPRGAQTGFDQAKRPRSRGAASSTALSHPWWMAASPGSGNDLSCGPSHEVFVPATGAPRPSPATWKQRGCWPSMLAGADLLTLTRADIDGFVADQLTRHRPTTAAVRFRSLQQFYRWAVEEELLPTSPMTGLRPPSIPDAPVPILDERSNKALLAAMNGRGFDLAVTLPSSACSWTRACVCPRWRVYPLRTSTLVWMLSSSARAVGRVRVPLARRPARQSSATSESE